MPRIFAKRGADNFITVPVVVHVIHRGEEIGKGSNISDAQIYGAITATNEDFAKAYKTRGDGVGVATPFRFVLANIDDKGNPTTGIYANWDSLIWDFGTSSEYPKLKNLPI